MTVTTRTSQQATDSTSFVVTLPDGSNTSGRRVIVVVGKDGIGTVTWPASPAFTQIGAGNGTDTHLAVAYRDIDGTEGFDGVDDTITVTGASEQWNAHSYLLTSDEFDSAAAPEAAATANATNNGTTDPPSLTPSWGSASNLWIAASALRFAGNHTAAPTNYTDLLSLNGGDTNAPLGTARRVLTATSEDPGTFSHDGGNTAWVATTIAVKPSASGLFTQTLTGTVTSAGAPVKDTTGTKTGGVTPTGAVAKAVTAPTFAGTLTPTGTAANLADKPLAGTLATAGTITNIKVVLLALAGTLTTAGSLLRQTQKTTTGAMSTAGTQTRTVTHLLAGLLATAGTAAKVAIKLFTGTGTPAGTVNAVKFGAVTVAGHKVTVPAGSHAVTAVTTVTAVTVPGSHSVAVTEDSHQVTVPAGSHNTEAK